MAREIATDSYAGQYLRVRLVGQVASQRAQGCTPTPPCFNSEGRGDRTNDVPERGLSRFT